MMPKFMAEIGPYQRKYKLCATLQKRFQYTNIDITCRPSLKGRGVKITTLEYGTLSMCQVAIYAEHG